MEMNQNASSRYQDIISKSTLISPGSPAVYQLRPKEEKFGTLTRKTVGEKNPNKTNRTILLVGETGTGKSTLINTLVNYTMGVKSEDNIWFKIVKREKRGQSESQTSDEKRSQIGSQTSDVIVYEIFGYEGKTLPYSLTIIDTPGFGNTEGIQHDVIISKRLLDLFRPDDGVKELSAVGLVMKATENRLNDWLSYILDSVTSLFGKGIEKNIVPLITHSNGLTPKNALIALEAANIKCAKNEKNQPVYFLFDNCQTEDRTENTQYLEYADKITTRGMKQFKGFLDETAPQKLKTTVDVLDERINLTACMQHLEERIELIELKQTVIQQTEEGLKKYEEEMKKNQEEMKKNEEEMKKHEEEMKKHEEEMKKNQEEMKKNEEEMKKHEEEIKKNKEFTVEVEEVYKEKEPISGGMWAWFFYEGAVTCTICEQNCHYPGCTLASSPRDCEVMEDGRCTVCTNKCPASYHVKEERIYVTKTKKVKMNLRDLKEKQRKMEHLQTEMEKLKTVKIQLLDDSYQHVVNLEQNALNDKSQSTHVHLDFLIKKMKETGDTEKVEKLEEMKSRMGKEGLWRIFSKLRI